MFKVGLKISLVLCLALPALAGNESNKEPETRGLSVSALLERAAKSPLGSGEVGLLRALADLIEQEKVAPAHSSAAARTKSEIAPNPVAAEVDATAPLPGPEAAATGQRKRLVFRLRNVPVVDVAEALEEFLDGEQKGQRAFENTPSPNRAVLVAEPTSNSLLVSGRPEIVDELTDLIAQLDAEPDMVMVNVFIAELLPPASDDEATAPGIVKDGEAWLARAKEQGRLEVLSRPQIMTLDNQLASIQIGERVPIIEGDWADGKQVMDLEVGLTVDLTPRVSPEGLVVMELDIERATVVDGEGSAEPILRKLSVQTTLSAKDDQTIVLAGLKHRAEDGHRQLVVALTPSVNPVMR